MSNKPAVPFADLLPNKNLQKAIESEGYQTPSLIQQQVIPHMLAGNDVLGVAQTGTGKTAAFALPILHKIDPKNKKVQVLCLTPTRELAIQVAKSFETYAKFLPPVSVLAIYGGTGYRAQSEALSKGVHIVVGTPGRLMDLMDRKKLRLDNLTTLVLDEADEMLRMGFIDDVEWILERTPNTQQTALFSATMPAPIKKIANKYLNKPQEVNIQSKTTSGENISQYYLSLHGKKMQQLQRVLEVSEYDGVIVFVRTKNSSNELAFFLQQQGFKAEALNGDIPQNQREKIVDRLKKGQIDIAIATDVAARGLDVKRISLVINYDLPSDVETYVHRIGRTGRAGKKGDAILFIQGRNKRLLNQIEKTTTRTISEFQFPSTEDLNQRKLERTFAKIDSVLSKDLSEYQSLIKQYLEHNPDVNDATDVAAAFAYLEQKGQPFFVKKFTQKDKLNQDKQSISDKSKQSNKSYKSKSFDRIGEQSNHKRSSQPMECFLLTVGEKHGAQKRDIVGALANEAGIASKNMGKITIFSETSIIDLPVGMPDDIFADLRNVRIRNQKINIKREKNLSHAPDQKSKNKSLSSKKRVKKGRKYSS